MTANDMLILSDEHNLTKFWNKIYNPSPGDPDACWEWKAKRDKNGYGILFLKNPEVEGKPGWKALRAPRLMWVIENDRDIPKGLQVQHTCDNPQCTNPRHLKIGTHQDNALDREQRRPDYHIKGEAHFRSVLTNQMARQICKMFYIQNMKVCQIARVVNRDSHTVSQVITGRAWKHATKNWVKKYGNSYTRAKERNLAIYQEHQQGSTYKELGKKYKLCPKWISDIVNKIRRENKNK